MIFAGMAVSLIALGLDLTLIRLSQMATAQDNGNLMPIPLAGYGVPIALVWLGFAVITTLAARAQARAALIFLCGVFALYSGARVLLSSSWLLSAVGPFSTLMHLVSAVLHAAVFVICVLVVAKLVSRPRTSVRPLH